MSNWEEEDSYCTTAQDYRTHVQWPRAGNRAASGKFRRQYASSVLPFLADYRAGARESDVLCNREIKFGLCLDYALRLGAQRFATGHYARCRTLADGAALYQARDATRISPTFCTRLRASALRAYCCRSATCSSARCANSRAPAACRCMTSPTARYLLIGERPFAEFLGRYLADAPGPIESIDGRPLGQHRGLPFYTLGSAPGSRSAASALAQSPGMCAKGQRAQRADRGAAARAASARGRRGGDRAAHWLCARTAAASAPA